MSSLLGTLFLGGLMLQAQVQPERQPLAKFEGSSATTTATFTVGDNWEVIWNSPAPVRISLLSSDGKLVAGVTGMFRGSLYQATGGTFYLQFSGLNPGVLPHWEAFIVEVGNGSGLAANQMTMNFVPPDIQPPSAQGSPGSFATSSNPPPSPALPPPAASLTAPSSSAPKTFLTPDQTAAVVMIEGDNADGTGFLVKMPEGPAIATNLHVLAANPHLRIHTNTGAEITVTGLKGAADRDLALLSIQDDHYSYLDLNRNINGTARIGDEIITPGNSEGGGVVLNTHGSVVALGPDRIEFSNPIYHGNSGGPVFHPKTGQVLGVVTEALKVDTGNDLDKASFASRNSAIKASMRYFGLRLDTVSKWEICNIDQFLNETTFLKEFHRQSRRLDSYLNSTEKTDAKASTSEDDDAGLPNSKLYLTDAKIVKANDDFFQEVGGGADGAQRLDALRTWLFTLNSVADTGVAQMQNPNNFYQFDQQRVREELSYRNALKKELDSCGDDISRVESLGRRSN